MSKAAWTPWHKVVRLRDDVRTRELSLAVFAADLYDVALGKARPVYQQPKEFFALTYPTFALRELAKDVSSRLGGKSPWSVRGCRRPRPSYRVGRIRTSSRSPRRPAQIGSSSSAVNTTGSTVIRSMTSMSPASTAAFNSTAGSPTLTMSSRFLARVTSVYRYRRPCSLSG